MDHCELHQKAVRILKNNIYEPNEYSWGKYRMISPCRNYFRGVWNWDSAFHAIGVLYIDDVLAKEQILGFLQFQKDDGMLPDVIFEDGRIEDHFTKPPLMIPCAWRVFEKTQDFDFLKKIYPSFVKNEKFWTEKRMDRGLFYFNADRQDCDSEEQHRLWVGYESGMDNSPRWDVSPEYYWAIDLNCYMVAVYQTLGKMAKVLGENSEEWNRKETKLICEIEAQLWDENQQVYVDRNRETGEFSEVYTPCSFLPLYVGFAPKERAEAMNRLALEHFLPAMPTVSYHHPSFSDDYWRGLCWLNVAYFAAKGLKNYGYHKTADTVKDTVLKWVSEDQQHIHENYNAVTGEGKGASDFSWSSVFVLEFIHNF